ncbi:MAG TPA: nuclear transport factor 2 family protein [Chthoniobacterales bacterium]|nr:nuclear transport factor 2 family protein [Chthoniobacterales bacterium]
MNNIAEFIDRYVAVWNEPDTNLRRKSVIALWAEDGTNLTRTIEARGYEALEARVARAHEKWVKDEGFIFRPLNGVAHHHNVMTFRWEMVTAGGGEPATIGSELFILGKDGRIRFDYQFLEPPLHSDELDQFVNRYIAVWNESDTDLRREGIATLWSDDGAYVDPSTEQHGYNAIETTVAKVHDEFAAKGLVFMPANTTDGHHNVVRVDWKMFPAGRGEMAASGSDFLVLRDDRRIFSDYRFIDASSKS